ncbi:MAG TPA: hypothetical protein PKL29_07780 [Methanothrix sp.]|nr:hypothetical protein [Methanothrix sp.]
MQRGQNERQVDYARAYALKQLNHSHATFGSGPQAGHFQRTCPEEVRPVPVAL